MAVLQENWKNVIFPNSINVEYTDKLKTKATICVEPLERGYGTTLGNSLRRCRPILFDFITIERSFSNE